MSCTKRRAARAAGAVDEAYHMLPVSNEICEIEADDQRKVSPGSNETTTRRNKPRLNDSPASTFSPFTPLTSHIIAQTLPSASADSLTLNPISSLCLLIESSPLLT